MKFALINNNRTTATKGAKGLCPNCGAELIAKCGDLKVNHWAHKGIRNCDPWWENETEWHRAWKSNFSTDWQEVIMTDETTGEKHIADIRSEYGVVVEFQHSHIDPMERIKRETFYKKMLWVVDGTRLKRDYPRFLKSMGKFRLTNKKGYYVIENPEECFPISWLNSSVPIVFDYKGTETIQYASDRRYPLYFLFPKSNNNQTIIAIISRESFIQSIVNGELLKERKEPEKQITKPETNSHPTLANRSSQYIFERGRFIKRKRF